MHAAWDDKVAYHPWVTVTLTSDLISTIGIESGAYLLYYLRQEFQFSMWMHSVAYIVTLALTSDLAFRIIVSGANLLVFPNLVCACSLG